MSSKWDELTEKLLGRSVHYTFSLTKKRGWGGKLKEQDISLANHTLLKNKWSIERIELGFAYVIAFQRSTIFLRHRFLMGNGIQISH